MPDESIYNDKPIDTLDCQSLGHKIKRCSLNIWNAGLYELDKKDDNTPISISISSSI
jgi:hypothetical protein